MNSKKLFWGLCGSLGLLIVLLFGSVYEISGLLKTKSTQLAANKAQSAQLSAQLVNVARTKHDITKYAPLSAITSSLVPQDKDQAEAVREISAIAAANGVPLTTFTFSSSSLGATSIAPAAGAVAPAPTATNSAAAAAAAANSPKAKLSQLTPVSSIPGVYDLQIIIGNNANNTVSFNQLDAFLKGLENNRRTAEVSSLSIQPQSSSPNQYVFNLTVNDYIKPTK